MTGNLNGGFAIGPEDRFTGIGRAGEGSRVDINDSERLSGLDDHVATRRQIHARFQCIAYRCIDAIVLEDFSRFTMVVFNHGIGRVCAEKGVDPPHRIGIVDDNPGNLGGEVIPQDAMNEILIAIEQHRRAGRLGCCLNGLPLAQQCFKVIDQQLLTDALGLGANQQASTGGLDQHAQGTQAVALVLAVDATGNGHPLAVGLKHQKTAR